MFTPTIIKILKFLRESKSPQAKTEIIAIINETAEYVNNSLDKLVALGIVREAKGSYSYLPVARSEELYNNLAEVHQKVNKRPAMELLVRGLICEIPPHYLVHANTLIEILQDHGLERKEISQFLEQEINNGYLRRIKVASLGIRPASIPVYVPSYYLSHLRVLGWEHYEGMKQEYNCSEFFEEDYLLGYYPPELTHPAREYVDKQGRELKDKLREKGVVTWLDRYR